MINIQVYVDQHNYRVIQLGNLPSDTSSVTIYRSYAVSEDWEAIATLDTGFCTYTDTTKLLWNKQYDLYYKASVTNNSGTEFTCTARVADGQTWPESTQGQALIKSISTEIEQNGRSGFLLKKRQWGTKCTCTDYGTGRSANEHCTICYGTGFVGGYYKAIELDIIDTGIQRTIGRTPTDYIDTETMSAKCIAFPTINREDIWVGTYRNDRYMINDVTPVSTYKGVPLVYQLTLKKIEQSDVIYQKTICDDSDSSTSDCNCISSLLASAAVDWTTLGR